MTEREQFEAALAANPRWSLIGPLFSAPPAQQPQYEAADMASAAAQGFRDGVASVAQQPQEPILIVKHGEICYKSQDDDQSYGMWCPVTPDTEHGLRNGTQLYAAPPAQQPQELEVQCPVCNHKFYEWPNDQQPQAEPFGYVSQHTNGSWEFSPTAAGVYPDTAKSITAVYTKQPQAEHDLKDTRCEYCGYMTYQREHMNCIRSAQQAEAVPSDVVRAVVICTECGGHGQVTVASGTVGWPPRMQVVTCQSCDGTGRTEAIAAQGEKP